jgi:23S rRNA pseudouridine1911/1915/1917 synthase
LFARICPANSWKVDMQPERHLTLIVSDLQGNHPRLDVYLSQKLPELTRSHWQKLINDKHVILNGQAIRAGLKLKGGEELQITIPANRSLELTAENLPLSIVYEDDYLAVIDKPAGMVTHPGAGVNEGTLVNALLFHLQDRLSSISGVVRPGIVHRLDKDTSGLLVIAKQDQSHHSLAEQIRAKTARRRYWALVEGVVKVERGTINKPIGRHPHRRKEMCIIESGRPAISHYQVLRRFAAYTLLQVDLETGRTHQIRVHMSSLGYPIVGDLVYNKKRTGNPAARVKFGLMGQALHARYLSFIHPVNKQLLEFEAPLPGDLQKLIDSL